MARLSRLTLRELLVAVPHSGILIPSEISVDSLSSEFVSTLRNVDWYTNWLYNFTDILDNKQAVFPWCSILLEANRHPELIEDAVPLKDVFGVPLYKQGMEPNETERHALSDRYLKAFHHEIETRIAGGAEFLLDGHSTIVARGMTSNQIDIMNFQHSGLDDGPKKFSPDAYAETYGEELQKRLPHAHITVNSSEYFEIYGHVCAEHSINAKGRVGRRVPALCQETCHGLYMNDDGTPDVMEIARLRRAFAEAIHATLSHVRTLTKPPKVIEIRNLRQTWDFDCGVEALQGVMAYYGIDERADALMKALGTDAKLGTSMESMLTIAESRGFVVETGTNWTLETLKHYLDQGHPVIVSMQAWADRPLTLKEWRENYEDGHYAVVIGYDDSNYYFEDPGSFHRTWLKERDFLARWHDVDPVSGEKLIRAGLVLLGKEPMVPGAKPME